MAIVSMGIDLAKNIFAVHGFNAAGRAELIRPRRAAGEAARIDRRVAPVPECLKDLPGWANTVIGDLLSEVHRLDERIAQYDTHIETLAKADERARPLMQLPGIGETTVTCRVGMIGNGREFACGRQLWIAAIPVAPLLLRNFVAWGKHCRGRRTIHCLHSTIHTKQSIPRPKIEI